MAVLKIRDVAWAKQFIAYFNCHNRDHPRWEWEAKDLAIKILNNHSDVRGACQSGGTERSPLIVTLLSSQTNIYKVSAMTAIHYRGEKLSHHQLIHLDLCSKSFWYWLTG